MTRTPMHARNHPLFSCALHIFIYNFRSCGGRVSKLHACAWLSSCYHASVHSGPNASKASPDDVGGLEPILNLCVSAHVMLSANLWVLLMVPWEPLRLSVIIIMNYCTSSLILPVVVTVKFDVYTR